MPEVITIPASEIRLYDMVDEGRFVYVKRSRVAPYETECVIESVDVASVEIMVDGDREPRWFNHGEIHFDGPDQEITVVRGMLPL